MKVNTALRARLEKFYAEYGLEIEPATPVLEKAFPKGRIK